MEKLRQLPRDEVKGSPVLHDVLEEAKAGGESFFTYEGATFILQPVEDLTQKFSPERFEHFIKAYNAAADPANRFTEEEAMVRFRQRRSARHEQV